MNRGTRPTMSNPCLRRLRSKGCDVPPRSVTQSRKFDRDERIPMDQRTLSIRSNNCPPAGLDFTCGCSTKASSQEDSMGDVRVQAGMSDDVVRPALLQVLYVGPTCWAASGRSQPTSKTITVHQVAARSACYLFLAVPLKANATLTLRPSVGAIRWVGEELGFVVHQLHVVDGIWVCCGGRTELSIFRHPRGDTKERHRRRSRKEAHELQQVNHNSSPRVLHNESVEGAGCGTRRRSRSQTPAKGQPRDAERWAAVPQHVYAATVKEEP